MLSKIGFWSIFIDKPSITLRASTPVTNGNGSNVPPWGRATYKPKGAPLLFIDGSKKPQAINVIADSPNELTFILDQKVNYEIVENEFEKVKQHIKDRV